MRAPLAVGTSLLVAVGFLGGCGRPSRFPEAESEDAGAAPLPVPAGGERGGPAACTEERLEAVTSVRPVDVLFVVGNTPSMKEEVAAFRGALGASFLSALAGAGLDPRVVLLSRYGSLAEGSLCLGAPWGTDESCAPPWAGPVTSAPVFHHSVEIGEHDALDRVLASYNQPDPFNRAPKGWSQWLRPEALKVFVLLTDDSSTMDAQTFDALLLAKSPARFGSAENRNYVFHTIGGLRENDPPIAPYSGDAPLQRSLCRGGSGAEDEGVEYQSLSVLTGGLRFPICQHERLGEVFGALAEGIEAGAQRRCEVTLPPGRSVAEGRLEYTAGPGADPVRFERLGRRADCARVSGFYVEGDEAVLCPAACARVKSAPATALMFAFPCSDKL